MTKKFSVEVRRSITTTVEVEAETPEAARDAVSAADFELPPREEWDGTDDWEFTVLDASGEEVLSEYS